MKIRKPKKKKIINLTPKGSFGVEENEAYKPILHSPNIFYSEKKLQNLHSHMEPSKRRIKTIATQALNLTPIMIHCPLLCSSGDLSFLLSLFTHTLSPEHLYSTATVLSTFLLLYSVFLIEILTLMCLHY